MAKILVVDDDPGFVRLARQTLQSKGYEVMTAASGQQALGVMRKEKPDLVLLEIMLSYILEGLDARREMAQDPQLQDVPVIVVTSLTGAQAKGVMPAGGESIPVDGWIHKPIDPDMLLAQIEDVLKGKAG